MATGHGGGGPSRSGSNHPARRFRLAPDRRPAQANPLRRRGLISEPLVHSICGEPEVQALDSCLPSTRSLANVLFHAS
jgi:hypothetical protein